MPVRPFVGVLVGAVQFVDGTLRRLTVGVGDGDGVHGDVHQIALFKKDEAVGHRQQGQLIGGHVVFVDAQAHHQRRTGAHRHQPVGFIPVDHAQRIGAVQTRDAGAYRGHQIAGVLEGAVDQVGDHLGVGLRGEGVTVGFQFVLEFLEVLDDAVMHHRQPVTGHMRVGVVLGRTAMGGPARVCDTQEAGAVLLAHRRFQRRHLALAAHAEQALVVEQGHARTVVAPIFQALQAGDQDVADITMGNGADDSTHVLFLFVRSVPISFPAATSSECCAAGHGPPPGPGRARPWSPRCRRPRWHSHRW